MTARQQRFLYAYLDCWNGAHAARTAGYAARYADREAYRTLRMPQVQAALAERLAQLKADAEISQARVLLELKRVAFSDPRRLVDGVNLRRLDQLDDDTAAAVQSMDVITRHIGEGEIEYVQKIKLWDKNAALDALSKRLGLDRPETAGAPEEGVRRVIFELVNVDAPSNKTGL